MFAIIKYILSKFVFLPTFVDVVFLNAAIPYIPQTVTRTHFHMEYINIVIAT